MGRFHIYEILAKYRHIDLLLTCCLSQRIVWRQKAQLTAWGRGYKQVRRSDVRLPVFEHRLSLYVSVIARNTEQISDSHVSGGKHYKRSREENLIDTIKQDLKEIGMSSEEAQECCVDMELAGQTPEFPQISKAVFE